MADLTVVPDTFFTTPTHWAFHGQVTYGVNDTMRVNGDLPAIRPYGDSVVVDGVSVHHFNGGVADVNVVTSIYSTSAGGNVDHFVGVMTVAAGGGINIGFYHPLGVPCKLETNRIFLQIQPTATAALDATFFSVWGHFIPSPLVAEPQEVTVKGVQFFPTRKKTGPV